MRARRGEPAQGGARDVQPPLAPPALAGPAQARPSGLDRRCQGEGAPAPAPAPCGAPCRARERQGRAGRVGRAGGLTRPACAPRARRARTGGRAVGEVVQVVADPRHRPRVCQGGHRRPGAGGVLLVRRLRRLSRHQAAPSASQRARARARRLGGSGRMQRHSAVRYGRGRGVASAGRARAQRARDPRHPRAAASAAVLPSRAPRAPALRTAGSTLRAWTRTRPARRWPRSQPT